MLSSEEDWDLVSYLEAQEEVPGEESKLLTNEDASPGSEPEKHISSNPSISKLEASSTTTDDPLEASLNFSALSTPSLAVRVESKARAMSKLSGGWINQGSSEFPFKPRRTQNKSRARSKRSRGWPNKDPRRIPYRLHRTPDPKILATIARQNPIPTRPDEVWVSRHGPPSKRMRDLLRGITELAPAIPTPSLEKENTFKAGILYGIVWNGISWARWTRES